MTTPLRLILFDVDGTLVDSQGSITAAMSTAFEGVDVDPPTRHQVLSIVGLSLDHAMEVLVPEQTATIRDQLVQAYKDAYHAQRLAGGAAQTSPLYPGARRMIDQLVSQPDILLGVATGKSRRGLDALLDAHQLDKVFVTKQVADHHPSKPHPSMVHTALAETGVEPEHAIMIGDTSFDMDMAQAAGIRGIGVKWGYHRPSRLTAAHTIIDRFEDLPTALDDIWKAQA